MECSYYQMLLMLTTCLRFARSHANHHGQTSLCFVHYGNPSTYIEKIMGLCKALVKHNYLSSWNPSGSTGQEKLLWLCEAGRL